MKRLALVSLGLSVVVGCRSGGGGGDDDSDDGGVDAQDRVVDIQDIQSDAMPAGTIVELRGVVVTAIDSYGARTGDFFVEEPEGGEFSGIKVFRAPLDQVASLMPGDIVTIRNAEKAEFALLPQETTPRRVTELVPANDGAMEVIKTGTGAVPAAVSVDAVAIAGLSPDAQDAEWERWEGVLITVTNPRQLTPISAFGAALDQREFDATGTVAVQTVLSDFTARWNTCYSSITGLGDYFFQYLLLPRGPDDFVPGGAGCAPSEIPTVGIANVQAGPATEVIELKDVFVAAVSENRKNLWLTTSLTAASNEGVLVFRGNGTAVPVLPSDVVVGATIELIGTAAEANNDQTGDTLTQITGPDILVKAAPTTPPVPVAGQLASDLVAATTGEPFESVLVSLAGVKVNSAGASPQFIGELQQGDTRFLSDDDLSRLAATDVGKCFDFVGIWTYQTVSNAYGLLPISKTEVTCP